MRRTSRTIVVLAAPLLMALGLGCAAKNKQSAMEPDGGYDAAVGYGGDEYAYAQEAYDAGYARYEEGLDGSTLAGSDSAPDAAPTTASAEPPADYEQIAYADEELGGAAPEMAPASARAYEPMEAEIALDHRR